MAKTNIEKLADVLDKISGIYVKEISRIKTFYILLKYKEEKALKFVEDQLQTQQWSFQPHFVQLSPEIWVFFI
jgi:hypothetical protein